MSISLMTKVWANAPLKGSHLLLLLAMADFANDDGTSIFPSLATLARKIRANEKTVRRGIDVLIAAGLLDRQKDATPRSPAHYRIRVENLAEVEGGQNVHPEGTECPPTGDKMSGQGGRDVRPEGVKMSTEPSTNRHLNGAARAGPPPNGRPVVAARHLEHAEAIRRLEASVHEHEWRGMLGRLHVVKASEIAVKLAYRTRIEIEYVQANYREKIAQAFDVPVSAVEIVKGGHPPEKNEEGK